MSPSTPMGKAASFDASGIVVSVKKVLIVALVVVLVLLAVPLLIPGMSMGPDCELGVMGGMGLCFTLVAFGLLIAATTSERLAAVRCRRVSLLRSRRLHRPPRFA